MSKFLMFRPLGGGEANTRFCLCSLNPRRSSSLLAILGKSISVWKDHSCSCSQLLPYFRSVRRDCPCFPLAVLALPALCPSWALLKHECSSPLLKQLLDPSSLWLQGLPHRLYFWRPCTKRRSRATFLPVSSTLGVRRATKRSRNGEEEPLGGVLASQVSSLALQLPTGI